MVALASCWRVGEVPRGNLSSSNAGADGLELILKDLGDVANRVLEALWATVNDGFYPHEPNKARAEIDDFLRLSAGPFSASSVSHLDFYHLLAVADS